jgi:hypothetical protein
MESVTLEYPATRPRRWWRLIPWRTLSVATALVLLGLFLTTIEVKQVERQIDAITGSTSGKTVWRCGLTTGAHMNVSPLETRLSASGIPWRPDWQSMGVSGRNIFGRPTFFGCASAPPIHRAGSVLGPFAAASTDAELQAFVKTMQSGTDAEKDAAVEAASEKGFSALSSSSIAKSQRRTEPLPRQGVLNE